jgi:UDP-N-acetylmuramate--alanine ligase
VAELIPPPARAVHAPALADAADAVLAEARPGDLVITMGAGDITRLGQELVARLEKQSVDGDPDDRSRPA